MYLLPQRATRVELAMVVFVTLILSGAMSALYVKLFRYSPPLPDMVVILPVMMAMVLHMLLRIREVIVGSLVAWAWAGLALLALASTQWSVSPSDTFRESLITVVAVPWLAMMAVISDWRDLLTRIWLGCVILLFVTLALYLLSPQLGRMQDVYAGALVGPWHEKNATGQFLCWTALLSLAVIAVKPARLVPAALVWVACVVALPFTQSATALLATAAGSAVFGWVALMRRHAVVSIPALLATGLLAAPIGMLLLGSGEDILRSLGRSGTLTGRLPIWEALRDYAVNERPLLGHGYSAYWSDAYSFGRREFVFDQLGFEARHSHNSFLEMRLALGWVGTGLWLAAVGQGVLMSILRIRSSQGAYLALPFIVAATAVALVEVSLVGVGNLGGMLFVLILAKMSLRPSAADAGSGVRTTLDSVSNAAMRSRPPHSPAPRLG